MSYISALLKYRHNTSQGVITLGLMYYPSWPAQRGRVKQVTKPTNVGGAVNEQHRFLHECG